jgi:hypothetical protein
MVETTRSIMHFFACKTLANKAIVRIYGPWAIYLIIQINSKSPLMEEEFSLTWEVEGNAPQLKRQTLLHVGRKSKRGGRARAINKSHTRTHIFSCV